MIYGPKTDQQLTREKAIKDLTNELYELHKAGDSDGYGRAMAKAQHNSDRLYLGAANIAHHNVIIRLHEDMKK